MSEWIEPFFRSETEFLRQAWLLGILGSLAFGVTGSYVIVRRTGYLAGAIAHSVLAGIGAALYFRETLGWPWLDPVWGALVAAVGSAVLLGLVSIYAEEREDTIISALWAGGMALGLLFLANTPAFVDPMSYLFGNILMVSSRDLQLVLVLDFVILGTVVVAYRRFLALSFDEEFALLRGIHVRAYTFLLYILIALTIVLLVSVVGIVLVIALLTLPPAIAGRFANHLWQMMLGAILLCALFVTGGLGLSYHFDLPSGPVIVLLVTLAYLAVLAAKRVAVGSRD